MVMTPRNSTHHHSDEKHQSERNDKGQDDHRGSEDRTEHIAWASSGSEQSEDRPSRQQNS